MYKILHKLIKEVKSLKENQRDEAFTGMLQGFVNWMRESRLSNTTIHQYTQIVIYYFSYHHDTDIAYAMVGHTTYLDMYDRKEDSEKLELYLKVESKLKTTDGSST